MTAIGTPTMTDAEERAWTEAQRSGRDWRGKPERKDHAYDWKRASQARPKAGAPVRNGCVHHWRIPEPDGNKVLDGVCGKCGAVRGFFAGEQDWTAKAFLVEDLSDSGDPRRKERSIDGYGW